MFDIEIVLGLVFAAFPATFTLLGKFAKTWDFPEQSRVRFDKCKQSAQMIPAFLRFRLIADTLQQTVQHSVNGMRSVFQRNGFRLAQPLHQQSHRCHMIFPIEQGSDNLSKAAGRIKIFDMPSPEVNIAGRLTGRSPFGKHSRNLCCSFY